MFHKFALFVLVLYCLSGCAAPTRRPAPLPTTPPPVVKPLPPAGKPAPPPPISPPGIPIPPEIPVPPVVPKPIPPLVRLLPDQFPLFTDDMDMESLDAAVDKSLQYYRRAAGKGPVRMDDTWVSVKDLQDSLITLREILRSGETAEVRQTRIRETFDVYQSTGSDGKNTILFTGYFEPIMKGALNKSREYRYPVYKAPDDAITVNLGKFRDRYNNEQLVGRVKNGELVPYYSRSEIEDQAALSGRNLELAWVGDRIDLFFLHTQGSGKIELADGRLLQIGYAKSNGRPYRSVGRFLLNEGKVSPQEISYQAIKRYLREHPDDLSEILGYNERFIFFRVVEQGPVGSIGEILTPGRSIATDAAVFPRGSLAFMRARKPVLDREGNALSWIPFSRFVVSQDAGGVIKGAGRVDLFCGSGGEAEMLAGSLKEQGELYFLVKKRAN
ncbi:MAG: MltA domain-containing protein [Proteobacteria bacterium]|nr:MltA domain-containing protein [Pseudomonadota bacterium]MBU4581660.1 MltA domain-containing protein [Pseudomonadota bacterium]MCG2739586.1 MltA domain-containing protein [Syntrophaceae bacterium]